MDKFESITGEKVGFLTVKGYFRMHKNKQSVIFHNCICDCGKETNVRRSDLIRKDRPAVSCGCKNYVGTLNKTHGMSYSRFYNIWANIKSRCLLETNPQYKDYGGRGIKVCAEWITFENFMNDMHESYLEHIEKYGEKETSIERVDPNGNYEKINCVWATRIEQNNNQRRHKKFKAIHIETGKLFYGTSKAIFAREHGVSRQNIGKVLQGKRKSTGGYIFKYID